MDKKCSGRHSCTLAIPDTELQAGVACPKDLVAYLNATFSCVKGKYIIAWINIRLPNNTIATHPDINKSLDTLGICKRVEFVFL